MTSPIIPYSPDHEVFCPYCNSLWTEYHPTIRWGRCHACGRSWQFPPHRRPLTRLGHKPPSGREG